MSIFRPRARLREERPKPIERLGDAVGFGEFLFSVDESDQGFKLLLQNPLNGNIPPLVINIDALSVVGESVNATAYIRELTKKKLKALGLVRQSNKALLSGRFTKHQRDVDRGTLALYLEDIWVGTLHVGITIFNTEDMSRHPYATFSIPQEYQEIHLKGYPLNN